MKTDKDLHNLALIYMLDKCQMELGENHFLQFLKKGLGCDYIQTDETKKQLEIDKIRFIEWLEFQNFKNLLEVMIKLNEKLKDKFIEIDQIQLQEAKKKSYRDAWNEYYRQIEYALINILRREELNKLIQKYDKDKKDDLKQGERNIVFLKERLSSIEKVIAANNKEINKIKETEIDRISKCFNLLPSDDRFTPIVHEMAQELKVFKEDPKASISEFIESLKKKKEEVLRTLSPTEPTPSEFLDRIDSSIIQLGIAANKQDRGKEFEMTRKELEQKINIAERRQKMMRAGKLFGNMDELASDNHEMATRISKQIKDHLDACLAESRNLDPEYKEAHEESVQVATDVHERLEQYESRTIAMKDAVNEKENLSEDIAVNNSENLDLSFDEEVSSEISEPPPPSHRL